VTLDRLPLPPAPGQRPSVPRELWGERTEDRYSWLRDADDPEVIAHLEAENAHTDAVLAPLGELRETLFSEFKTRIKETDLSVPVEKDGWSYYSRTEEGQPYGVHCRKSLAAGENAPEVILVDENAEAIGSDYFELGVFDVSPNHVLLLWAADRSGDEKFELRIRDLSTGAELDDVVPDVSYGSAWAMDNETFFYVRVDDAHRPFQVWQHRLGNPVDDDLLVFEEPDERFFVGVGRERDDSYIQIGASSAITDELWLLPADEPNASPRCFAPRRNGIEYAASHHEGRFIVLTNDDAENFRIVETPVEATEPEHWVDLVSHRENVHLSGFDALRDHLVIFERVDAVTQMRARHWASGEEHVIAQAEAVSTVWPGANPTADTTVFRYGYSSMVTPPRVLRYDLDDRTTEVLKETEVLGHFDASAYETRRSWAIADDGTEVPMSLVWRRDRPEGPGPAVIGAYGAYEISSDPSFSTMRLSLLDRGFLIAIAHVRGGGELGRRWYMGGKFENKRNTFADTVACARHLIEEGWTTPEQLGLRGGSAGGLLVGAALNLEPGLFGAAVAQVPFVDALNTMLDPSLPLTVTEWEEWGNPADSEAIYREMRSYTPYENIQAAAYPSILATAGLNDPRVGFWEPAKWVLALREQTTGSRPILLQTDLGAGHGGPSGRYDSWRDEAKVLAFVIDALAAPHAPLRSE
jgi:oligopeptidase B